MPESSDGAREKQRRIGKALGVGQIDRHIFLCCDQTKPKCCDRERSLKVWAHLKQRLKERGLTDPDGPGPLVYRTKANCLRICENGPIAVVYPEGTWYGNCDEAAIDRIIDEHLVGGEVVEEHVIERGG